VGTRIAFIVIILAVAGVLAGCAGGGGAAGPSIPDYTPPTQSPPADPDAVGALEGDLTDGGAGLVLQNNPLSFANTAFTLTIANMAYDFTTDAAGHFRVDGIPVGQHSYSIFNDTYYKEGAANIASNKATSVGALSLPAVQLAAPSGNCSFTATAYGYTGYNSYSEYVTAYVYKIRWDNLRAPSYGDYRWLSGTDTSGYALFQKIPVPSSQIYKYKCSITYLVKYYDNSTGTFSDGKELTIKRYANIYPTDTNKWLSGSTWLKSYEIKSKSYY
jgi:hypothetical protein